MANIVKPVPVADYGRIFRDAFGIYQGVRGEMRREEEAESRQSVDDLAQRSYEDPEAWEQLKRVDPARASQIQKVGGVDLDRFYKYRAETALEIAGLPPQRQTDVLIQKASELKNQGRDPAQTLEIRQRILSGDETVQDELKGYVEQGYQTGILRRPPQQKQEGQYRIATDEEKQNAGLDVKKPYQISPKGQFIQIGSKGQTINVNTGGPGKYGTIPPGFALRMNRKTNEFEMYEIKGGPAAKKTAAQKKAENKKNEGTLQKVDLVQDDINRLSSLVERQKWYDKVTGVSGEWLFSNVPGTARKDAEGLQKTIEANIGFDRLQQMRDESPTGGALGQVSERELDFLKSTMGNINFNQSDEQILYNLKRMNDVYSGIKKKVMDSVRENPGQYPKAEEWLDNQNLATPVAEDRRGQLQKNQMPEEMKQRYQ